MTGFPGFIAGRLVERLAKAGTRFMLLVQPQLLEKARQDIERIASAANTAPENFRLIPGDITKADLGMTADEADAVRQQATAVFHLAAVYDLGVDEKLARKVNFEGTKHVNDFVVMIENLRRYNYISTCYVAGMREGTVRENELEHRAGFRNYYEETKYDAEVAVEKLKSALPVTIYRPSVVCGDSRTGETPKYDGIYYLIRYLRKFPKLLSAINIGNPNVRLNFVPVDFVVEAIAALSQDEQAIGKTVQLADPAPLTTEETFNAVSEALGGHKSFLTPPEKLAEWVLMQPIAPVISGLPNFGVPYFFLKQTYDTSVANSLLGPHGVSCPPFNTYVKNLCEFVEKHPDL